MEKRKTVATVELTNGGKAAFLLGDVQMMVRSKDGEATLVVFNEFSGENKESLEVVDDYDSLVEQWTAYFGRS